MNRARGRRGGAKAGAERDEDGVKRGIGKEKERKRRGI